MLTGVLVCVSVCVFVSMGPKNMRCHTQQTWCCCAFFSFFSSLGRFFPSPPLPACQCVCSKAFRCVCSCAVSPEREKQTIKICVMFLARSGGETGSVAYGCRQIRDRHSGVTHQHLKHPYITLHCTIWGCNHESQWLEATVSHRT